MVSKQATREEPWEGVIIGQPYSKANNRKFATIRGKPCFIKSAGARAYAEAFAWQCKTLTPLFEEGDLHVTLHIWYGSRRPDLDESLILDLLQGRVYRNDRQVKTRSCFWHLDPARPRTWIRVEPMAVCAGPDC